MDIPFAMFQNIPTLISSQKYFFSSVKAILIKFTLKRKKTIKV
jgi:hypothetical protein